MIYSVSILPWSQDRSTVSTASVYLHWEAIKFAKLSGYDEYDMGGIALDKTDPNLYGIGKFKLSFGGRIITKYTYIKEPKWIAIARDLIGFTNVSQIQKFSQMPTNSLISRSGLLKTKFVDNLRRLLGNIS